MLESNDPRIEKILILKASQNQSTYHTPKPKEEHTIKHAKIQRIRSMKPTKDLTPDSHHPEPNFWFVTCFGFIDAICNLLFQDTRIVAMKCIEGLFSLLDHANFSYKKNGYYQWWNDLKACICIFIFNLLILVD